MIFKDWRECSQEPIELDLDPSYMYYLQAQAWHLKGYLGGTHSYCTFFHEKEWLVVEMTDAETLEVQNADIRYQGTICSDHAPFISNRLYNAQWFGNKPYVVDKCPAVPYDKILQAVKEYPIKEFNILHQNCNTFTSYLIASMDLNLKRPFRSVGFRNKKWWKEKHGIKVRIH